MSLPEGVSAEKDLSVSGEPLLASTATAVPLYTATPRVVDTHMPPPPIAHLEPAHGQEHANSCADAHAYTREPVATDSEYGAGSAAYGSAYDARSASQRSSYERRNHRQPPAPLNLSSYALSMLQHTQRQMDSAPDSPPPPPHIRVAGPIGTAHNSRRRSLQSRLADSQHHDREPDQQHQGGHRYSAATPPAVDDVSTSSVSL